MAGRLDEHRSLVVQLGTQDRGCLGDCGYGGVSLVECVEHDEVVDDPAVPHCGGRDSGGAQFRGVSLALVTQHVGLAGDDQCRRQSGELLKGGAQR